MRINIIRTRLKSTVFQLIRAYRVVFCLKCTLYPIFRYIKTANNEGRQVTLADMQEFLKKEYGDESFHKASLARALNRWGFEFGKGIRTQHLKEKDHVVAARSRYLREKRDNRTHESSTETKRPEVYLDESYVNRNHSNDFTWYYGEDGPRIKKPAGKGSA